MWKYILIIAVLFSLFGCNNHISELEDEEKAWLEVYYEDNLIYDEELNDEDDLLSVIIDLPDQSQITLDKFVNKNHHGYPPEVETFLSYIVWAKKADYYTQYTLGYSLDTLQINASGGFTPVIPGEVCGAIYSTRHAPFRDDEFVILQDSVIVDTFTTSSNGYFNIDISFGSYQICLRENLSPQYYTDFIIDSFYDDYFAVREICPEKPNIYIYPEEKMNLDVSIIFPHGGNVTNSIPDYGNGWKNLRVEPSGKINNEFTFLFYESSNTDLCQYHEGWIIEQKDLESFFIRNLSKTGFKGQEIIDFTDYWIPLLIDYPYYTIYPQYKEQLNKMVKLEFSIKPDNLLRILYAIEGMQDNSLVLPKPEIPEFKREGFFVVEWGVSIRNETELSVNK